MRRTVSFPGEPASVSAARRFVTEALTDAPSEALDAVELMVSELVTNCIRHADAAFELTVVHEHGTIRVEVTDPAGGTPTIRSPGPDDRHGRGLQIVNMLSGAWGVRRRTAGGKTVWFTVAAPPPASARTARDGAAR